MKNKLLIILASISISCSPTNPYQEEYCGKQIVNMKKTNVSYWIRVREKENISEPIYLTKFDWEKFQVGDTIPCLK